MVNISKFVMSEIDFTSRFVVVLAGAVDSLDESTLSEDSLEPNTPIVANEETNDSDSHSSAKR